ncbi:MAG TPA: hypothetical protein VNO31_46630, partial [Umezawaea sp.]|nr:hypothetical protein [Umezawaea sp.]
MRLAVASSPSPRRSLRRLSVLVVATATLLGALSSTDSAPPANAAPVLLSQGKPVTASSTENAGTPATAAVDGNA